MALIGCGNCGNEISDRANACPHCGNPIGNGRAASLHTTTYIGNTPAMMTKKPKTTSSKWVIVITLFLGFSCGLSVGLLAFNDPIFRYAYIAAMPNSKKATTASSQTNTSQLKAAEDDAAQYKTQLEKALKQLDEYTKRQNKRAESIEAIKAARNLVQKGEYAKATTELGKVDTSLISTLERSIYTTQLTLAKEKRKQ